MQQLRDKLSGARARDHYRHSTRALLTFLFLEPAIPEDTGKYANGTHKRDIRGVSGGTRQQHALRRDAPISSVVAKRIAGGGPAIMRPCCVRPK